MNGVKEKRLGRSYGFEATSQKTYRIKDIEPAVKSAISSTTYDAITIHCGINDLKDQDPKEASEHFTKSVKKIATCHPGIKFVVSKIAPTTNKDLNIKRQAFNALITSELYNMKNISFVFHKNLHHSNMKDTIHPTFRGSSVLAVNLGRHLRNLFWEQPKRFVRAVHHHRQMSASFHPSHVDSFRQHQEHQRPWWNRYSVLSNW